MIKLKPCPCCGSKNIRACIRDRSLWDDGGDFSIFCQECPATLQVNFDSIEIDGPIDFEKAYFVMDMLCKSWNGGRDDVD